MAVDPTVVYAGVAVAAWVGWRYLRNRARNNRPLTALQSPAGHEVEVHGESFHQKQIEHIVGGRTPEGAHYPCTAGIMH